MTIRGSDLTRSALRILRDDKELLWIPVLATLTFTVTLAAFLAVWAAALVGALVGAAASGRFEIMFLWLAFSLLLVAAFVLVASIEMSFFRAAITAAAAKRLDGADPRLRDGFRLAWRRFGRLAKGALVVALIGMVVHVFARWRLRAPTATPGVAHLSPDIGIMGSVLALGWSAVTMFMTPVLLFEEGNLATAVRSSAERFGRTWKAGLTSGFTLLGYVILPAIMFFPLALGGAFLMGTSPLLGRTLLVLALVDIVGVFVFASVVRTILTTVLYRESGAAPATTADGTVQPPSDAAVA